MTASLSSSRITVKLIRKPAGIPGDVSQQQVQRMSRQIRCCKDNVRKWSLPRDWVLEWVGG